MGWLVEFRWCSKQGCFFDADDCQVCLQKDYSVINSFFSGLVTHNFEIHLILSDFCCNLFPQNPRSAAPPENPLLFQHKDYNVGSPIYLSALLCLFSRRKMYHSNSRAWFKAGSNYIAMLLTVRALNYSCWAVLSVLVFEIEFQP